MDNLQEAFTDLKIDMNSQQFTEDFEQQPLLPQWKDITAFLDEATADFDIGQLAHLGSFTLFDAMSAIVIMDPRMDTGMNVNNNDEPQEQPFDIHKRLSAKQALNVMDQLVVREMAWISGHSLSQTVFTCIYFHHIQTLNELPMPNLKESSVDNMIYGVLKAFISATMKCCHYIFLEMSQGNVYEEEDFTTNLFGLSFNEQQMNVVILNDLDFSLQLLDHLISASYNNDHERQVFMALRQRVELRKLHLLALIHLSQYNLDEAKKELTKLVDILDSLDTTLGEEYSCAFDANINRKLTSQTPPRTVELASAERSYKEFEAMIKRLKSICGVTDFSSVTSLMNYFLAFGSRRPYPDAFSRSKLNSIFYHDKLIFGKIAVPRFILAFVGEIVRPPYWFLSNSVEFMPPNVNHADFMNSHDVLKSFLERISMVFLDFFKINCHNRARQRRMLMKLMDQWELLQEEAAGVDEVFHGLLQQQQQQQQQQNGGFMTEASEAAAPYYFSSWAYDLKLMMIEKILFLGFELDLYGTHEYMMVYWYTQCVLGSRAYLLERMATFTIEHQTQPSYSAIASLNSKTAAAAAAAADHDMFLIDYVQATQLSTQAKKCLCEAILKLLLIAQHTGQLHPLKPIFDDEETRYLHRFKCFANLSSPPHPPYSTYVENFAVDHIDVPQLLMMIRSDLERAKQYLENILALTPGEVNMDMCDDYFKSDVKDMVRAVVANTIGMNLIKRDNTSNSNIRDSKERLKHELNLNELDTTFKYHSWFLTLGKK